MNNSINSIYPYWNIHVHIQQRWSNVLNVLTDAGTVLIFRGQEIEQLHRYLAVQLTVYNIVSPAYTGIASDLDISLFQACLMFYTYLQAKGYCIVSTSCVYFSNHKSESQVTDVSLT
jgi:hypothetical protein